MTPVHGATPLNIQEMPRVFSKHRKLIITSTLLCAVLFGIFGLFIPKRYKTSFVMTITSKYFQSPLIGDFVPGLGESFEGRSQRESLIRQTLTPEYLDSLGTRYGIYRSTSNANQSLSLYRRTRSAVKYWLAEQGLYQPLAPESLITEERQNLLSRIQILSLNSTTFQIGFRDSDPKVAYEITQDLYRQNVEGLMRIRMHLLTTLRDAMQKQLGLLGTNLPATTTPATVPPDHLMDLVNELQSARDRLRSLSAIYTDVHPNIQQLKDQIRSLENQVNSGAGSMQARMADRQKSESGFANREVFADLTRKLNYLSIAIDSDDQHQADYFALLENPVYPTAPLSPKKALMPLWGLVVGFLGSIFVALIREYFERTALRTAVIAHWLKVPVLGSLPKGPKLLDASTSSKR